jgi:hypothetical protein
VACAKIRFPDRAAAGRAAGGLSRRQFAGWRGKPFVRVYRCRECSAAGPAVWHMTRSKPHASSTG